MEMNDIRPGSIVRLFTRVGGSVWRATFGHVVTAVRRDGADKPTLTVVTVDPQKNQIALGRANWKDAVERHVEVEHFSHPDVAGNRAGIYYLDAIPPAHEMDEVKDHLEEAHGQAPAFAPAPPAAPTPADLDAVAEDQKAAEATSGVQPTRVKLDCIDAELSALDSVEVEAKGLIAVGQLQPGDVIPHFGVKVVGTIVADGVLQVATEKPAPSTEPASEPEQKGPEQVQDGAQQQEQKPEPEQQTVA